MKLGILMLISVSIMRLYGTVVLVTGDEFDLMSKSLEKSRKLLLATQNEMTKAVRLTYKDYGLPDKMTNDTAVIDAKLRQAMDDVDSLELLAAEMMIRWRSYNRTTNGVVTLTKDVPVNDALEKCRRLMLRQVKVNGGTSLNDAIDVLTQSCSEVELGDVRLFCEIAAGKRTVPLLEASNVSLLDALLLISSSCDCEISNYGEKGVLITKKKHCEKNASDVL